MHPILTPAQIEQQVMTQFPKTEGEKKCAFERAKMNELRNWKRNQLRQQNQTNERLNKALTANAGASQ